MTRDALWYGHGGSRGAAMFYILLVVVPDEHNGSGRYHVRETGTIGVSRAAKQVEKEKEL
ncbi:hypothetical protein DSLASN_44940 [Desulfoluna limicola]|uniref:Uncharacterized protein n=1 Tax=Desulfoluna limicola TaxID=2810562 RepID=A0ABM7PP44_9BACT|nr:hypothetical protein DSLASN_44940 [Desulfoluna limicola]